MYQESVRNIRAQLLLYRGFYTYKTSTRSRSASATNAAKYPTCAYLDFEYQYTALSIVLVALRQRVTKGKENNQRVPRMATRNPNSPILCQHPQPTMHPQLTTPNISLPPCSHLTKTCR